MTVIILQCSQCLSDCPHTTFSTFFFYLSSFHLHSFVICVLPIKLFIFLSASSLLYSFISLYLKPSSVLADNTLSSSLPPREGWVKGCYRLPVTLTNLTVLLQLTPFILYLCLPAIITGYTELNTKARNVKGVATCLRCQTVSSVWASYKHSQSIYYLWLYSISIQKV